MQTEAKSAEALRRIDDVVIEARDGAELAANVYVPSGLGPVPVLVSAYPYRKDDMAGAFNEYWRRRLGAAGYGTVLVDSRGTGASRGVAAGAATAIGEAQDGYDAVEWAARQPWSSGAVGMWGSSYGGALALATAAQRPPHLRVIVCAYGYADSYQDGIVPGGCPACLGRFAREAMMLAFSLAPPSRRDADGRWREVWEERLSGAAAGPGSLAWLEHPDLDAYWEALQVDVERIEVPTLLVAGWYDLYAEAMARVYRRLHGPKRMLAGPWLHVSPELAERERIDWLHDVIAWSDLWLREREPGVSGAAPDRPFTCFVEGAGWCRLEEWPPPGTESVAFYLASCDALARTAPASSGEVEYVADPTVGVTAGLLDPLGIGVGYPLDQGPDERKSLCFTAAPCREDMSIIGSPVVELWLEATTGAELMISAKLNDVAPDGRSTLVTRGYLDVAHAATREAPVPPTPGERVRVSIGLSATGYRVAAGHRLRLVVACSDFPAVWPARENATIRLHHGAEAPSRIVLPVTRGGASTSASAEARPTPVEPSPELSPWDAGGGRGWTIEYDLVDDAVAVSVSGQGVLNLPDGTRFELEHAARAVTARARPHEASLHAEALVQIAVPGEDTVTVQAAGRHTRTTMAYSGTVTVGGAVAFDRRWEGGDA
jgi:hypothetical protein